MMEQLEQFYGSLPPELQEKISMLEPEEQQQVLMQLMQRYQDSQSEYAQMGANPQGDKVPVEAERNETVTVQDGEQPQVEGGYLKKLSENPVSGQATYEIPDNDDNNTHEQIGNGSASTGVNMHLKEGDVVNSDKTKIPTDFRVDSSNFKGKTFKQASDYISKKENEIQKKYNDLSKKGKVDKVSEGSISLMLAKLAISRNQLNELQEIVLNHKEKKEETKGMRMGGKIYAQPGTKVGERIPYILDFQMPNLKFDDLSGGKQSAKIDDNVKDRMVNVYKAEYPVINARYGTTAPEIGQQVMQRLATEGPISMKDYVDMHRGVRQGAPLRGDTLDFGPVAPIKVNTPSEKIFSAIYNTSLDKGLDPAFMLTMAHIESGFNPNIKAKKSSATGLFQFTDDAAKQYGLLGNGFDKRKDLSASTIAAADLLKDNEEGLRKYSIPVTPVTLYLAHQQGLRGVAEIYQNAISNSPISSDVLSHMENNYGKMSGLDYMAKTYQDIMGRYNEFAKLLDKKNEQNDYEAFNYKQKYSSNLSIDEIKKNITKFGYDGLVKRTKAGNPPVAQTETENTYTQAGFKYGGYINHGYNISVPGPELMGKRKDYLMDGNYSKGGSIMPHGFNISVPGPELMGRRKDYLMDGNYSKGGYVAPHGYDISVPGPELMGRRRDYLMDGNYAYGGYASKGITIPQSAFDAINQLENTEGTLDAQGNPVSMGMGDTYAQSKENEISDYIINSIGQDTWNKMPDALKTQVYSFMFNHGTDPSVWKGIATAIAPDTVYKGAKDIDEARQNLDANKAINIIKSANLSDPNTFKNYIDQVLPQQYQSIADNYRGGFDRGQELYNKLWSKRPGKIQNYFTQAATPTASTSRYPTNPFTVWQGDINTKPPKGYNKARVNMADYTPEDLVTIAQTMFPDKTFTSNQELQQAIIDLMNQRGTPIKSVPFGRKPVSADTMFGDDYNEVVKQLAAEARNKMSQASTPSKYTGATTGGGDFLYNTKKVINTSQLSPEERQKALQFANKKGDVIMGFGSETDTGDKEQYFEAIPDTASGDTSIGIKTPPTKIDWAKRINYGIGKALPYLRDAALLFEKVKYPTFRQLPYNNPYESMSTDYSIQSALNDIDRTTLTTMADTRGNPSVRNARNAQAASNALNAKNQLYTQKYNMENQLRNQKHLGEINYLNQHTLSNMNLADLYEQRVNKADEVKRQQTAAAIDNMANTYLQDLQNQRNIELALAPTVYTYDQYGNAVIQDPIKAAQEFHYRKEMMKYQGSGQQSPYPGYHIEMAPKFVEDKATTAKGGTIKRRKKLSLKSYG